MISFADCSLTAKKGWLFKCFLFICRSWENPDNQCRTIRWAGAAIAETRNYILYAVKPETNNNLVILNPHVFLFRKSCYSHYFPRVKRDSRQENVFILWSAVNIRCTQRTGCVWRNKINQSEWAFFWSCQQQQKQQQSCEKQKGSKKWNNVWMISSFFFSSWNEVSECKHGLFRQSPFYPTGFIYAPMPPTPPPPPAAANQPVSPPALFSPRRLRSCHSRL